MAEKVYLGDSVYADWIETGWGEALRLTTENGVEATNTIVLDQERWRALEDFVSEREQEIDAQ